MCPGLYWTHASLSGRGHSQAVDHGNHIYQERPEGATWTLWRKANKLWSNAEIVLYQCRADKFFEIWLHLFQKEGITNYIHMIGSGHITDCLYKWENLVYHVSQQGWEAMNSSTNKPQWWSPRRRKKCRLVPIARWLQRRRIFLCRIDEEVIRQYSIDNPTTSIPPVWVSPAKLTSCRGSRVFFFYCQSRLVLVH